MSLVMLHLLPLLDNKLMIHLGDQYCALSKKYLVFYANLPSKWWEIITILVVHCEVKSLSHIWLFATPWAVAHHASLSMGFSRQEYWSGLPFPSPGDLPNPGIEPRSPVICENYKDEAGKSVFHIISVLHILNLAFKRVSTLLSMQR